MMTFLRLHFCLVQVANCVFPLTNWQRENPHTFLRSRGIQSTEIYSDYKNVYKMTLQCPTNDQASFAVAAGLHVVDKKNHNISGPTCPWIKSFKRHKHYKPKKRQTSDMYDILRYPNIRRKIFNCLQPVH